MSEVPAEFLEDMAETYPQEPQPQPGCMVFDLFRTWRLDSGSYEAIAEVTLLCTSLVAERAIFHNICWTLYMKHCVSEQGGLAIRMCWLSRCSAWGSVEINWGWPGGYQCVGAAVCGCAARHAATAAGAHALQSALGGGNSPSLQVLTFACKL